VGNKGGGIGYIVAYDAKTGSERWRFMAIPGPSERGHETWTGNSWKEGGAPTWLTGSYDAKSDTLIWGVGNPKPDYNPSVRAGDNLYSDSVVALQGTTGKLKWYFQFTPADERDWDSNQIPVLVDRPASEGTEKQLLWANRNGFFYILDRESGKFQRATPFVQQTWTDGIDSIGRPMQRADLNRHKEGYLVFPGNEGGTNWWSPSFDSSLDLFFVAVVEQGMVFFSSGDDWPSPANRTFYTAVRALDARTGHQVWEYRHSSRTVHNETGGVLTTAGGLLFGGDLGMFFALDSRTGKRLWSVETGSKIDAAPITYEANGEQFVVITSGRNTMAFALPNSVDGVH
jgi:alcohol dehydrogenase (cytochrome c)